MSANAFACSKEITDEKCAQRLRGESYGINQVVMMLKDDNFAQDIKAIFERNGLLK